MLTLLLGRGFCLLARSQIDGVAHNVVHMYFEIEGLSHLEVLQLWLLNYPHGIRGRNLFFLGYHAV